MSVVQSKPDDNLPRWRAILLRLGSAVALIACLLAGVFAAVLAFLGLLLALSGVSIVGEIAQFAAAVGISLLGAKTSRWLVDPPADDRRKSAVAAASLGLSALLAFSTIQQVAFIARKTGEGRTMGNLNVIRDAINKYHRDMEGQFPDNLAALTVNGKCLTFIPYAHVSAQHPESSRVALYSGSRYASRKFDDAGGWGYVTDGPSAGRVFVNCTHTDTKGSVWSSY